MDTTERETQLIGDAVAYAEELFRNDFSGHDFFHTLRVYRLAVTIAEKEGADTGIVALAALLHDADDRKLSPETYQEKRNAVRFLREHGVPEETIRKIVHIISQVSFSGKDSVTPDSLEGKCVQDADRLDAIGAIGIARTFAYGGSRKRAMYDPSIPPETDLDAERYHKEDRNSPTVNHFYEKLLLLRDMMGTGTAKRMAEERHHYMELFLEEFYAEWNGER